MFHAVPVPTAIHPQLTFPSGTVAGPVALPLGDGGGWMACRSFSFDAFCVRARPQMSMDEKKERSRCSGLLFGGRSANSNSYRCFIGIINNIWTGTLDDYPSKIRPWLNGIRFSSAENEISLKGQCWMVPEGPHW